VTHLSLPQLCNVLDQTDEASAVHSLWVPVLRPQSDIIFPGKGRRSQLVSPRWKCPYRIEGVSDHRVPKYKGKLGDFTPKFDGPVVRNAVCVLCNVANQMRINDELATGSVNNLLSHCNDDIMRDCEFILTAVAIQPRFIDITLEKFFRDFKDLPMYFESSITAHINVNQAAVTLGTPINPPLTDHQLEGRDESAWFDPNITELTPEAVALVLTYTTLMQKFRAAQGIILKRNKATKSRHTNNKASSPLKMLQQSKARIVTTRRRRQLKLT